MIVNPIAILKELFNNLSKLFILVWQFQFHHPAQRTPWKAIWFLTQKLVSSFQHHRVSHADNHYFHCMLWRSDACSRVIMTQVNMTALHGQIGPSALYQTGGKERRRVKHKTHRNTENMGKLRSIDFSVSGLTADEDAGEERKKWPWGERRKDVEGRGRGRGEEGSGQAGGL